MILGEISCSLCNGITYLLQEWEKRLANNLSGSTGSTNEEVELTNFIT